jgi:hypothetical protein
MPWILLTHYNAQNIPLWPEMTKTSLWLQVRIPVAPGTNEGLGPLTIERKRPRRIFPH